MLVTKEVIEILKEKEECKKTTELEARFGYFNNISGKLQFVPGVSYKIFEHLKNIHQQ